MRSEEEDVPPRSITSALTIRGLTGTTAISSSSHCNYQRSQAKKESSLCPWESSGYMRRKDNIQWDFSFPRSIILCLGNCFTDEGLLFSMSEQELLIFPQCISVMIQGAFHFVFPDLSFGGHTLMFI